MTSTIKFYLTLNHSLKERIKLNHNTLLQSSILHSITNDQKVVCNNDLTDKESFDALKGIPNNKCLGNDELTKEFYEIFWDELRLFYEFSKVSLSKKGIKHFSTSSNDQIN